MADMPAANPPISRMSEGRNAGVYDEGMGRAFIAIGIVLVVFGLLLTFGEKLPIRPGRLPGDIVVRGKNTTFYFPLVTSLLLSVLLSFVIWLLGRRCAPTHALVKLLGASRRARAGLYRRVKLHVFGLLLGRLNTRIDIGRSHSWLQSMDCSSQRFARSDAILQIREGDTEDFRRFQRRDALAMILEPRRRLRSVMPGGSSPVDARQVWNQRRCWLRRGPSSQRPARRFARSASFSFASLPSRSGRSF